MWRTQKPNKEKHARCLFPVAFEKIAITADKTDEFEMKKATLLECDVISRQALLLWL
jgi:hypothetical protein